jgi:type I restriction enzyme S subunit
MMETWKIMKLGDVCEFVRGPFGGSLKKSIFKKSGFAVYEQQHAIYNQFTEIRYFIDDKKFAEMKRFELKPNDLIMSCSGTMGKVAIVPDNIKTGIINQALLKLTCSNQVNVSYLKLWMESSQFIEELEKKTVGAAIKNVASVKVLKTIQIPIPPLPEQQRIVSILDECFAAIDKAKANAEHNLKNAAALFESYLQGVFEKKGDSWEEKKIDEICKLINGKAYKKEELLSKGKYRVLRVGNFFTSNHWYYSDLELDEDKYCDSGDLLYAWSASFGPRIWKEEKVIYHYHIWKVIPDENLVTRDFLYTLFEWDKEKIKAAQGTGTTMIHVSKGSMDNRIVPVPPIEQQQTIVRQLDALRAETQKLEAVYQKKINDLEELKKSILQKAFAGELETEKVVVV